MSEDEKLFCAEYQKAIEMIGSRWTGAIIRAMLGGLHRFSEIAGAVPGLSDRMLSERLKELEAEGVVERIVLPEVPVRVEYHLTEKGRGLSGVMGAVVEWLETWGSAPAPLVRSDQ